MNPICSLRRREDCLGGSMNNVSAGAAEFIPQDIIDLYEKMEAIDDSIFADVNSYGIKRCPDGAYRFANCVIEIRCDVSDELQELIWQATELGFYCGFDQERLCTKGEPFFYYDNGSIRVGKCEETVIQHLGTTLTKEVRTRV